jgi:hypothetical protein
MSRLPIEHPRRRVIGMQHMASMSVLGNRPERIEQERRLADAFGQVERSYTVQAADLVTNRRKTRWRTE